MKDRKNVSFVFSQYALLCYPYAVYSWLCKREFSVHGRKLLKNKDESREWRDLAPSARNKSSIRTKINRLFTSTIGRSSAHIIYIINKLRVYFFRVSTEYMLWIIRVSQLSAYLSFPNITPDNREYTIHGSSSQINVTDINLAVTDLRSGYQIFLACKSSRNFAFLEIWKLNLWVPPMKKGRETLL